MSTQRNATQRKPLRHIINQPLVWRVLGLGSRLQEVRQTIQGRGVKAPPQLSALFSLAYRLQYLKHVDIVFIIIIIIIVIIIIIIIMMQIYA